jgi:rhamnosyltransferase
MAQTIVPKEIVVIDSGSSDGSVELVKSCPIARLIQISPDEFNHGETRNIGVRAASSTYVLMTVQDARPASPSLIDQMLSGMTDDRVAGVGATQVVPHEPDKNPVEWFRPQSSPELVRFQFDSPEDFLALSAAEKRHACAWDNVGALYRRDVLLALPFPRTLFAEDVLWAREAYLAGYALVYNTLARVFHYHAETPEFTYRREIRSMYYRHLATGYVPETPPLIGRMLRVIRRLAAETEIGWSEKLRWIAYNWRIQAASRKATRSFRSAINNSERQSQLIEEFLLDEPLIAQNPMPSSAG